MSLFRIALLSLFVSLQASQSPAIRPTLVQGIIVHMGTNEPVARSQVVLTTSGKSRSTYTVETSDDGTFRFPNLEPGEYRLAAKRAGYLTSEFAITLSTGQQITDIRIAILPSAVISGRITGRNGHPEQGATVRALRFTYENGRLAPKVVRSTTTDDRGNYRLSGLSPGRYLVSAATIDPESPGIEPAGATSNPKILDMIAPLEFPPIYFPGVGDALAASPIRVQGGATASGIDIQMMPLRTHRIRGVVLGSAKLPAQITLIADPIGTNGKTASVDPKTGSFEFPSVAPGSYFLVTSSDNLSARVPIEIRSGDEDRIQLQLAAEVTVSLVMRTEDKPTGANNPDMSSVRVRLENSFPNALPFMFAGLGIPDNTQARVSNVPVTFWYLPGDYRVTVSGLPSNAYVKSIRQGDADVLTNGIHIDKPSKDPVVVTIGLNSGSLGGMIVNDKKQPISNATFVLIPDASLRRRSDLYKTAIADAFGQFQLQGIPPGDYTALAWEYIEPGDWLDADFLKISEDQGRTVHVGPAGKDNILVTAVPPQL